MHIFDTTVANLVFKNTYIINALVNLQSLISTFYKIDLLLKHQNGEFKYFQAN